MKKKEIMAMAAIGIVMVACSDNELHEHGNDWEGNEPLELSASISETVLSKADGNFTAGEYYFSYVSNTQTSLRYTDTKTDFDVSGTGKSYLTWDKINTNSSLKNKLFILDNVPYQITNEETTSFTSSDGKIDLSKIKESSEDITGSTLETTGEGEEEESIISKYTAAPAPEISGKGNDLLWATVKVDEQIPLSPVHFKLEHKMAMLTFDLYSKNGEIKELLKEDVTVKLEGVITEPTTFNRVTGVVSVDYPDNGEVSSYIDDMGVLEPTEDEEKGVARCTQSWIFPPQQFHNIGRPILEVTLKDEETETKTFRGRLPESMIYNNKSELLEFMSGCHLIIEVELGNWDNMEIRFRPVLVRKWIPKTIVDINVDQVGVRTANELLDLVNTYNDNPNNPILWRYGVLKNNNGESTWYFDLWSHISDYTEVNATDKNDLGFIINKTPGFIINSHNYKVNGKIVGEDGNFQKDEDTTTP